MHNPEYSVAMTQELNLQLLKHLVRVDLEEDLMFSLWTPSYGSKRLTALVHTPVFPESQDRQRHGNASFNPLYFERACKLAIEKKCGIAFMHSHPFPGWQDMSEDDITAENKMMGAVLGLTGLPLLGMTTGSDGFWSARFWVDQIGELISRQWCSSVRVIGKTLKSYFNDRLIIRPKFNEMFSRTITVWGEHNHIDMARLTVGIVGLGSVGGSVAMSLARMGLTKFKYIDFDEVQVHNLDRLEYATLKDINMLKVDVAKRRAEEVSTASKIEIEAVPYSIVEEQGYMAALDCDVLLSCVDRPRPRSILNHMAYAHLIPTIDGGINVRFRNDVFAGAEWQLQTIGPERVCLECLGVFSRADVATETEGKLDDPSYLSGLPISHRFRRNENVYPFCQNLASLETMQFVALTTGCGGYDDFGVQRFRYNPGILEFDVTRKCSKGCGMHDLIASGDTCFKLYGMDIGANQARKRRGK